MDPEELRVARITLDYLAVAALSLAGHYNDKEGGQERSWTTIPPHPPVSRSKP